MFARKSWTDILLPVYVIPKTKLRAYIARVLGRRYADLQHAISNATIKWYDPKDPKMTKRHWLTVTMHHRLSMHLSIGQFRAVTSSTSDPQHLLQSCHGLMAEGAAVESVRTTSRENTKGPDVSKAADQIFNQVSKGNFSGIYVPKIDGSTHILLHVHGGGFVSGSPEVSAAYLLQLNTELQARGCLVDIFSVRYDLAPESQFPSAFDQVLAAYEHLSSLGKPIILVGESAGGNLCMALCLFLHRASMDMVSKGMESCPIIAMYLSSPWLNLEDSSEAFQDRHGLDCLDSGALKRWREAYIGAGSLNQYSSPLMQLADWERILPPKVCIISGEFDLFEPDISAFAALVKKVSLRYVRCMT